MDTIVVTASGVQQRIKDAPASISVLTQEDIKKGNYESVADAVRSVEGVSLVGDNPNTSDIVIRGLPGEYTLILIDGQRQNTRETMNRGTSGIQSNLLPPLSAIERIEVIRGPMSSLYGSEAMGGVINIITKKVPSRWSGSVAGAMTLQSDDDYGNSRNGEFWLGGPIQSDVLGLQIWGKSENRSEAGNFYPSADTAYGRKNQNLGVKLTARPDSRQKSCWTWAQSARRQKRHLDAPLSPRSLGKRCATRATTTASATPVDGTLAKANWPCTPKRVNWKIGPKLRSTATVK